MKKTTKNLLVVGVLATGLLGACSSETTTGTDAGNNTSTEETQTEMEGGMTDTTTTDMSTDTSSQNSQNPPTDNTGNQDQQ